jgi:DNA-binding winged helix-turn-helix (wHTH) protein
MIENLPKRVSAPRKPFRSVMKPSAARKKKSPMRLLNEYPIRPSETDPQSKKGHCDEKADIDGVHILVRFLVGDIPAEMQSDFVSTSVDLRSLLSSTFEKMVDQMRGPSLRSGVPSKLPLAVVELMSSWESLVQKPVLPKETVLRVGPLALDLLDRTAKRDGRQIDLRPREFALLKYMMEQNDKLQTRATLLKEVWHYKFVPENMNLVDVHLGRLRRKVDGPNEAPMIRNVRGFGFVLSATPLSQDSLSSLGERPGNRIIANQSPRS